MTRAEQMNDPAREKPGANVQETRTNVESAKIETSIGLTLKVMRESRGLSVRTLAGQSGFSPSFLSQVENGQASPSIGSLERIARVLGVTLGEFFVGMEASANAVCKASERREVESRWSKARIQALFPTGLSNTMVPLVISLEPQGRSSKHTEKSLAEQFAYVLEGSVRLFLREEEHDLTRGDSVTILAGVPHRWENRSPSPVEILLISPRF
jgi:quercetin dioxygenase-like cupin family protein